MGVQHPDANTTFQDPGVLRERNNLSTRPTLSDFGQVQNPQQTMPPFDPNLVSESWNMDALDVDVLFQSFQNPYDETESALPVPDTLSEATEVPLTPWDHELYGFDALEA